MRSRLIIKEKINFKIFLLVIIMTCCLIGRVSSATVNAATCAQVDVQNAINSANSGDTINIPSGTCTYTGSASVPSNKKLILHGQGIGNTIISAASTGTQVFDLTTSGSWVDNIEFDNTQVLVDGIGWRIHDCKFNNGNTWDIGVFSNSNSVPAVHTIGVVDHCTFINSRVVINGNAYLLSENSNENILWNKQLTYGSGDFLFVESCNLSGSAMIDNIDSRQGGSYVFRYNIYTDSNPNHNGYMAEVHSFKSDATRAARGWEIYNNTIISTAGMWAGIGLIRAGTGVIFNNTIIGSTTWGLVINNERDQLNAGGTAGLCDGTSSWDQNTPGMAGWRCRDQIGTGRDGVLFSYPSTYNQTPDPAYFWGNTPSTVAENGPAANPDHLVNGRDYYNNVQKPGYAPYYYPHPLVSGLPGVDLDSPLWNSSVSAGSVTFNVSAIDASSLTNVTLYGNWTGTWSANQTKTLTGGYASTSFTKNLSNGTYIWAAYICNNNGNCRFSVQNYTLIVGNGISQGAVNVTTTLVSPTNGYSTNNLTMTFNCSVSDSGGNSLTNVTLYGNWTGTWSANQTISVSGTSNSTIFTKTLTSGSYLWNCLAYDNINNVDWGNNNYTFTVDTTNPQINITFPSNNTNWTTNTLNVNYTASDLIGIGSCWYSNDSYSINTSLSGCANITNVVWSNGQHNVTIWVNDTVGNLNSSEVSFNISGDTVYPLFSNYTDNTGAFNNSGIGLFNVTVTNTNGTVLLEINGVNVTAKNTTDGIYNVSYNFTSAGSYSYRWYSWGNGFSQNFNKSDTRSYTVNGTGGGGYRNYSTSFPLTENPINESGNWTNGKVNGIDWYNVVTVSGYGMGENSPEAYSDPTAVLVGNWSQNQTVWAKVYTVSQTQSYYQEVELRLRSNITAHNLTGYEVNFRATHDGSQYVEIVRWNGPVGSFNYVVSDATGPGLYNGDIVGATINGNNITAYINGVAILSGTDSTFKTGNPGMGFDYGCANTYPNFAFTNYNAVSGYYPNLIGAGNISYPIFSNYNDNSGSLNNSGIGTFNVTLANTNGTVLLQINGINVTANNLTANVYNTTYTFSSSGTYSYNWLSWGNGTNNNFNISDTKTYTVNKVSNSTPPNINFTAPTPSNASSQTGKSVLVNVSSSDASDHSVWLDWNGTLAGWWNFDSYNSSGVYDNSTWNNFGAIAGSVSYDSSGARGQAVSFNGIDNAGVVNVTNSGNGKFNFTSFTISLWAKRVGNSGPSGFPGLAAYGIYDGYFILWMNSGTIRAYVGNRTYDGSGANDYAYNETVAQPNNAWIYITYVFNSSDISLYLNSTLVGSTHVTNGITFGNETTTFKIGCYGSPCSEFNGSIDEVLLFNRTLNANEIQSLYNASKYQYYNNFTNLANGNYTYKAYAIDASGNMNSTETRSIKIASEASYPIFSTYWDNNGSLANSGTGLFNVTLTNTNGTVLLEINGQNITAQNLTDNIFNASYTFSSPGIYSYHWDSWSNGTNHNFNTSDTRGYTVNDTIFPNIVIIYPSNNTNTTNNQINVNYTISDNAAISSCWYSNSSGKANYTLANCANITGRTWLEGINNITIWVNDTSNNLNFSSVTFTVDTTKPAIAITYPSNNTNWSSKSINVNYTASDSGTGIGSCWYSNSSGKVNYTLASCANITGVNWTEGVNNVTIWANDTVGNTNSSSVKFIVDTIQPNVIILSPANNTNSSNNQLAINYSKSDIGLGVQACWYSNDSFTVNVSLPGCANITGVTWADGTHNVRIYANDTVGNTNYSSVIFSIDTKYPIFSTYWDNTASLTNNGTGMFNVTLANTNGTVLLEINGVNVTAKNMTSNVYNATYFLPSSGNYSYRWYSWGNGTSNNFNKSDTRVYSVNGSYDITPPTIAILSPANNTNTSNTQINVNYTASDNIAVYNCWYSNDSMGINVSLGISCSNITNVTWSSGQHNVRIYANDTSGNINSAAVRFTIDLTPPNIQIVYPASNVNSSNNNLNVNYTSSDNLALFNCWYSNDSMTVNISLPDCSTNITSTIWTDGQHNVTVWANDTAGNVNSSSVKFYIDTAPPYFTNLANQNLFTGQSLNYDINAADSGVGLGTFAINWTNTFSIVPSTGVLTNTSGLSAGTYLINVSVNDSVGNLNSSILLINVTGDTIPPVIALISPANGASWTSSSTVTFNYVPTDNSNIANCSLILNNAVYDETGTVTNGTNNLFVDAVANGNYNWNVNCTDTSNNQGNSSTYALTVSYTAPGGVNVGGGGGGGGGNQGTTTNNTNSSSGNNGNSNPGNNITNISTGNTNNGNNNWLHDMLKPSNIVTGAAVFISCIIAFVGFMMIRAIRSNKRKETLLSNLKSQ